MTITTSWDHSAASTRLAPPCAGHRAAYLADPYEQRRLELRDRVLRYLEDYPGGTRQSVAVALGVTPAEVSTALGSDAGRMLNFGPRPAHRTSDQDLLADLRAAAALVDGPISRVRYQSLTAVIGGHSGAFLVQRFGSWVEACRRAGVVPGRTVRDNYRRQWTREDMLTWVARYLATPGSRGSYAGYSDFAKRNVAAPSGQTVRNEIGSWATIKTEALSVVVDSWSDSARAT